MTQSSFEVSGKQNHFFMCCDAFLAQKICLKTMKSDNLKIPYLAPLEHAFRFYLLSRFETSQGLLVIV